MSATKDPDQRKRIKALERLLREMPLNAALRELRKKFPPEPYLRPIPLSELGIFRHESEAAERPPPSLLKKIRAKEKILRAKEKAQQEALLGNKRVSGSPKSLTHKEHESPKTAKTAQETVRRKRVVEVRRWRDTPKHLRLSEVVDAVMKQGGERFALNLNQEKQQEAWREGIAPLRKRISTNLRRRLGHVPDFALALDVDDDDRLHVHGVIVTTTETKRAISRALRDAAGIWKGPAGNSHQLRYSTLDFPHVCTRYMLRNHDRLQQVQGQLVARTRPATASARTHRAERRTAGRKKRRARDDIVY